MSGDDADVRPPAGRAEAGPSPGDAADAAVVCEDLVVAYDEFALGPVDVELPLGRVVSLLGPNGSGKSTLIRAILGFVGRPRAMSAGGGCR